MKTSTLLLLLLAAAGTSAPAQETGVKAGEAFIRKFDMNSDGWLTFEEFKDAAEFKKLDKNKDGRLQVGDWMPKPANVSGESMMMMMSNDNREQDRYYGFQTIAKYDRNRDAQLDEDEIKFLLLLVIDTDEDRVLNQLEIKKSRTFPGLALEDGWFAKEAKLLDTNGDTVVTPQELRVPEVIMRGLDKNKDGRLQLEELARAQVGVMGGYLPRYHELSDLITQKSKIDRANWLGDANLFHKLDEDKDGVVSTPEFDRYGRAIRLALSLCPDFITRHDMDGDQKVSRREFAGTDSVFQRMDRNRDGFVTSADK
jgi:Ca2+-binding EF-hand superfamily protein